MAKTVKLALVVDSEQAFLNDKVIEIYKKWGYKATDVSHETTWTGAPQGTTLFGDETILHLNLENNNDLKAFVSLLTNKRSKEVFTAPNWFGNGIIITVSQIKGATKVEKLVKDTGGQVFKKADAKTRKKELLSRLSLTKETTEMVNMYVGEDYQMLVSFVRELETMPTSEQKAITPDKALTYFPSTPGSTLPWEFINPLLDGNTTEAIQKFNRTIKHAHVLVPLTFLQRNISMLLRVGVSRQEIPNSPKKLAESIGEKAYGGFWGVYNVAKRTSLQNIYQANLIVAKLEGSIKGAGKVDPASLFRATIAELGLLLNH